MSGPPRNLVVSLSALTESASCHDLDNGLKPSNWRRVYLDALDIHIDQDNSIATTNNLVQAFASLDLQSLAALFLRSLHDPAAFPYEDYLAALNSPTAALNESTAFNLRELECTNCAYYATNILRLLASMVNVDRQLDNLDVTNASQAERDPASALRLSFRGASTTLYPRNLLQFQEAAPLIAVVEVKRGDRYRDVSAAACAYLLAVAQRYFDAFPTATVASAVVVVEHRRPIVEPGFSRIWSQFVSYVLYRAEIPRSYVDQPGCMRILVTVSRRYSTEAEEDRVALGTALMDTVLCSVEKAENDAAILGTPPKRTEPEPFVRRVKTKAGSGRLKETARLVSGSRDEGTRKRQHAEDSSSRKRRKVEGAVESGME
ncbi:hypothetical protein K440DRAFT_308372 [Wilcoxina mikolae CBS 423.85]|nr:hypothetical protein K440DRAFT_308372 [Wilcoxina mikolae CBS 423.85]